MLKREGRLDDEQLTKRLFTLLLVIVGVLIILFLAFTSFAPQVGAIFKLFSRGSLLNAPVIKPNTPTLVNVPEAVKENKVNLSGYAQPGATIKLYVNGPEKGSTTVGADGLFTFSNVELIKGRNSLFAKAIDSKNVESDPSETRVITMDEKQPELDIESPKDGDTVKNLDKRITIKGKLNEKATLKINEKMAIVKPDYTFEFLLGVDEGNVEIKFQAVDEAGNKTEKTIKVKYEKSSQ